MDQLGVIITASGTAVAGVIAALALYRRSSADAGRPRALLQRLWDWVETKGYDSEVPSTLAADIRRETNRTAAEEAPPGEPIP